MKLWFLIYCNFTLCWQSAEEKIVGVGLRVKSLKEKLTDEFRQYMAVPLTNWRVNNVMQWWGQNEDKFPNVSKLARKYLAIPVSTAPSERVFSQLKLIVSAWSAKDGGWIQPGLNLFSFSDAMKTL